MTPEERVLAEIEQRLADLVCKIAELKVSEDERRAFNAEKAEYLIKIDDYKRHRDALKKREEEWFKNSGQR